jgi:hypothetical protein
MSNTAYFISPYNLGNLLAPVDGTTHAAKFDVNISNGSVNIPISSIQQTMGNFQPQSCWFDNSENSQNVVISELVYGWQITINAGESRWFNFPSIQNALFVLSSAGSITATVSFFDFPALPDSQINISNSTANEVTIAGQPINVEIVGGSITTPVTGTSGSVVSTGASQVLFAANANRKYLLIGAPQSQPIWVNFIGGAANAGGADCFQIPSGGFYESNVAVLSNEITVFCAVAGQEIPAIQG